LATWLEALSPNDLQIYVAGNHFAATQTMDEETRREVTFGGAFGSDGPVFRRVRNADESTLGFSAIIMSTEGETNPRGDVLQGQHDEFWLYSRQWFKVAIRRGRENRPSDWRIYEECTWRSIRVNSTLDQVMLNVDLVVPGYTLNGPNDVSLKG
jgi:hypothetical protein